MRITLAILFLFSACLQAEEVKKITAEKDRIIKTVRFLSEENFPRTATYNNKEKTIEYLLDAVKKAELQTTRNELAVKKILSDDDFLISTAPRENKTVIELKNTSYTNINVLKKGKTNKRIIVGAHYDAVKISPGADDNASGVAVLVELAYLLKNAPELNCDVELAFYDGEEIGLYGSTYHARKMKSQNIDIVCMLCMDMVGYYTDAENSQDYPINDMRLYNGTKGNFLAIFGKPEAVPLIRKAQKTFQDTTALKLLFLPDPEDLETLLWEWGRSDYEPFLNEGYPALIFSDSYDYRNEHYHKKTDTWDTLDYDRLVQVPVGLYHVVLMLDRANERKPE